MIVRLTAPSFDLTPGVPTYLGGNLPASLTAIRSFAAGKSSTLLIGNAGDYHLDKTAVKFALSTGAILEPATWALLLVGFGLTGAVPRRRTTIQGAC